MSNNNILAIDLAKNCFQLCKLSPHGKVIYNRELSRKKLKEALAKEKIALVAMESCSGAHYWARLAKLLGHQVKVINARAVKAFQTKQKTDKNDALAIGIAAMQEHIHSVRVLSIDEQSLQALSRSRELALNQQIAQSNHIRGLLSEFGVVIPQGYAALKQHIPLILEDAENGLTEMFRRHLHRMWEALLAQLEYVVTLTNELEKNVKMNPVCQKLMKLEGVGPLGALGLALRLGKGDNFASGRDASANIGLTPKQHSSGGKERIGHVSKRSADKRLRSILFQGALAVINHAVKRVAKTNKELWLQALVARRGKKVAAIALANKTVRTAYALLKNGSSYEAQLLA